MDSLTYCVQVIVDDVLQFFSIYQIIVLEVVKEGPPPDVTTLKVTRYYHNKTANEPYITAEFKASEFKTTFIVGGENSVPARRRRKRELGILLHCKNGFIFCTNLVVFSLVSLR